MDEVSALSILGREKRREMKERERSKEVFKRAVWLLSGKKMNF